VLRIHFTEADLRRVRVVAADPLWETVLGVQQLAAKRHAAAVFAAWRQRARNHIREQYLVEPVRLVHRLAPEGVGYFPDFLTPPEAEHGLTAGLTTLMATPHHQIAAQLTLLTQQPGTNRSVLAFAARGRAGLSDIASALQVVYTQLIRPDWTDVDASVQAECALRAHALRTGGVHGLLHSLRPTMHWNPPTLSAAYPEDRDLHLAGRGIRLAPSHFCWRHPVALADPTLPQTLVYPVDHRQADHPHSDTPHHHALSALLGATRAQVLAATARAATTTELAHHLQISPASVSAHAGALRQARLLTSTRHGSRIIHLLTPLGAALVHGELPADICVNPQERTLPDHS